MMQKDFKYLNVPALLARKAWIKVGDSIIEDVAWSMRFSDRIFNMVRFFRDNNLLIGEVPEDISELSLWLSDFTEEGKLLIMSGAPDKWLASFDRNPEKSSADVSLMARKLKSLRKPL